MSIPARVAIVGGAGKVGRRLIPILLHRDHEVVALARTDEQLHELAGLGAAARHLDIEACDEPEFASAFGGCDAVVFTAGGGPDGNANRKRTVDLEGSLKSIAGAKRRGIKRFVQVSAMGVDAEPDPARGDVWTAYVYAKREADFALRGSGLAWTILRPGILVDSVGTGCISIDEKVVPGPIPRVDVAQTIASCLSRPRTAGHQWEIVTGPHPIGTVLDELTVA
ncbi:SDR family oxidoreductase [Demequina mangrovi]|uniref:NAD(P)H-binding n=1 Tax=Demequina mangrovi TaxID=1043493 RepID=A0A1H6ZXD8_9MICO|nr:SDR family oxidoreductase [Demequina mangrovi]SEJ58143.1 NAD(P)H-binding [Demequina mangrovi]